MRATNRTSRPSLARHRPAGLFDEATLAAKFAKYLRAAFAVRSEVHAVGDRNDAKNVTVIWVTPHPDGRCVFTRNGDYTDRHGKAKARSRPARSTPGTAAAASRGTSPT